MNRPTKEQVEEAMRAWPCEEGCTGDECVLTREVRALQAEAEQLKEQLHQQQQTHARQLREMGRESLNANRDPFGGMDQ